MYNKDDLKKSTLTELREIAEKIKLEGYERLKKEYLIEEIVNKLEEKQELAHETDIQIENEETDFITEGILEVLPDGFGFLRSENFMSGSRDVYVSTMQIKRFSLSTGDHLKGIARFTTEPANKFPSMIFVQSINGDRVDVALKRKAFDKLIPIYPEEKLKLDNGKDITMRILDILAPIGKGSRGMIVAPPKAGKTTILKQIATSITKNNPEVILIVLLIDERPEEVTDIERSIDAMVISSTFDESPEHHMRVAKMVLERAKRLVETNKDVVILLDSITRLARASNLTCEPSGRTLSGGIDPACLHFPKKFFGAARNIEKGGSLTILGTALIETGSRMDDIIFEEFKGTGNMEIHLDRKLSERRIFPAVDIVKSSSRREELLLSKDEIEASNIIRKLIGSQNSTQAIETVEKILNMFAKTKDNTEFIDTLKKSVKKSDK